MEKLNLGTIGTRLLKLINWYLEIFRTLSHKRVNTEITISP